MKRFLPLFLLILLLCLLPTLALALELPVMTDDKVDFSHMSIEDLHALNDLLDRKIEARSKRSLRDIANGSENAEEIYVWIPGNGKRYHANSECSGMSSPKRATLEEAVKRGLTPCSRCDPPELSD